MPHILIEKAHTMKPEKAKRAVLAVFEKDLDDFDLDANWKGLSCQLRGRGVVGELKVQPASVVVDLNLSILSKASGLDPAWVETEIRRRLDKALA